jgi:hypothetical protein
MVERVSIFDGGDNSWVREYLQPRYPELVDQYLEASRLFRESKQRGAVSARALERLTVLAACPRTPLGENVASMLGELYDLDKCVAAAIRKLAAGSELHERINALIALDSCGTDRLHVELFSAALTDRSARVRTLAADKIVNRGIRELYAEIKAAFLREKKPGPKAELAYYVEAVTRGASMTPNTSLESSREP